jgi:two-component system sensor histidine kinase CpxA
MTATPLSEPQAAPSPSKFKLFAKLPLFWRLFLAMLLTVLFTSALTLLVERTLMAQAIDERMRKQVSYLTEIQTQIAQYLQAGDIESVKTLYKSQRGISHQVIVVDSAGDVLFPAERWRPRSYTPRGGAEESRLYPAAESRTRAAARAGPTEIPGGLAPPLSDIGKAALKAWRDGNELPETTVTLADGRTANIHLYPRLPYGEIIAMKQSYLGLRFALLLLFSILVCYWLSRSLTGRIRKVQHTVHELSHGHYAAGQSLTHLGQDELGALAQDIALLSQRLQQSDQARQQMLSDISHELRSPLARLEVATELAHDRAPQASNYLDRIQKESARLNALIGQIIHIQSLQMGIGSGAPEKSASDIVQIIEQIGLDVRFEFQQKDIQWHYQGPDNLALMLDAEQVHSALENIIRNAFMHTPAGRQVSVKVQTMATTATDTALNNRRKKMGMPHYNNDRSVIIDIQDEGSGITEADIDQIFQPFVRLDSARQRQTGGHGLGLAIAHAVITAHGGQITAANRVNTQGANEGLSVRVTLPLITEV